ncbi:MAG TPA: 16S rRNA (cytosine(967)-C(5))-methyltransferase RsmB [Actinomycetota bacterium]|nr:16S rRNA (cytosine(967)-C(5))-methyltransferase RsmB [Actinomycetota bacterium]
MALQVLERVRTTDAYANLVLPAALRQAGLSPRDSGLATELAFGTLRMKGSADWVLSLHCDRPPERIDPPVLDALRLGVYQLLWTSVPAHAAVSETVQALGGHRGRGYVNAVLRRVAAAAHALPWPESDGDPVSYLQIRHSHPEWVVRMWLDEMGFSEAKALCSAGNHFPGIGIRATASTADLAAGLRQAGLQVEEGRWSSDFLGVSAGGSPTVWPGWDEGLFSVQDESSVLVVEALGLRAGMKTVDACAGPGGKTAHIAASGAMVAALEPHPTRAALVRDACSRMGVGARVVVVRADATAPPVAPGVDRVLVDAPCSGLGVLRRRPEARWRVTPDDVARCARLQSRLLNQAVGLLGPGGACVYSVCTVTAAETVDQIQSLMDSRPDLVIEPVHPEIPRPTWRQGPWLQLVPHVHGTDGMFIARIRRQEG